MNALPQYIDAEAWGAFVELRQALKVPFTPRAQLLIIRKLMRLHSEGWCPNASLEMSAIKGWRDVYPIEKLKKEGADAMDPALAKIAADRALASPMPASVLALKERMRSM